MTQSAPLGPDHSGSEPDAGAGGRNITGLDSRRAAALAVLSGWVGAVFLYLHEPEDRFVRFYSLQTLAHFCLFLANCAIAAALGTLSQLLNLPFHFPLLVLLSLPVFFAWWVLMLGAAWRGRVYLLPLAGAWCKQQARL